MAEEKTENTENEDSNGRSCERHRELLQDLFNQGDKQCESCLLEYYGEDT
jgi:hypothetical protein